MALLSEICPNSDIYGIERIQELYEKSRKHLIKNEKIHIIHGDGSDGLLGEAPFDRILVSACTYKIPENLIKQLKRRGILIIPIDHSMIIYQHGEARMSHKIFSFVPLVHGVEK